MARVRRKTSAATRWNLEVAGILALGFALLLGVALVAPAERTGVAGAWIAAALHFLFGFAAGWFVALVALVAAIVFLEINVPKMIATLGGAACAYFVLVATAIAASGRDAGIAGGALYRALHALVGDAGVWIVLVVLAVAVTVAVTGVSLKKVIGWCVARLSALRPPPGARPGSLREAFHLPALLPRPAQPAALAAAVPAPTHTVVETEPARFYDEDDDEALDEDDDLEDDEYDDEYDEDDDALEDDAGDDDEIADEPEDEAPGDVDSGCRTGK